MANFLFKKSFQLKTFKPIIYDDLWGKRGVFSTIRIIGKKPKYILFDNHLKKINLALKKLNINFTTQAKGFKSFLDKLYYILTLIFIAILQVASDLMLEINTTITVFFSDIYKFLFNAQLTDYFSLSF